MCRSWVLALAAVAVHGAACGSPFTGPVSPLYMTGIGRVLVTQGTHFSYGFKYQYGGKWECPECIGDVASEGVFAVAGTIRTRASWRPMGIGGIYTLTGTPTGVSYATPHIGSDKVYDGTSDGRWNYFPDYVSGDVYRTDSYWQNPEFLFNTGGCPPATGYYTCGWGISGIAYDPWNKSLWIASQTTDMIREYSLDGSVLREFAAPLQRNKALALDPADHTLWLTSASLGWQEIQQWSTSGELLQQSGRTGSHGAAEFDMGIPEPGTFALFAGGLAMLAVCGWRRTRLRQTGRGRSRG